MTYYLPPSKRPLFPHSSTLAGLSEWGMEMPAWVPLESEHGEDEALVSGENAVFGLVDDLLSVL